MVVSAYDLPYEERTEFKASLPYTASSKSAGITMRLSQKTKTLIFSTIRSDECFYTMPFKTQVSTLAKQRIRHSDGWDLEATGDP